MALVKPPPELDDTSPMPFGMYKFVPMQDVPVSYLHWYWHNGNDQRVLNYIQKSLDALKTENPDLIWTRL